MKSAHNKLIAITILLIFGCAGAFHNTAIAKDSMRIAAIVNEDAITDRDVKDRLKLILASSGLPNTKEFRDQALPQVLNSLIEERLMMQEASRNEIAVENEALQAGFAEIAKQNNFSADQFKEIMRRGGIPQKTLLNQIEAQLSWTKYIQTVLRNTVDVKDSDVDALNERLRSNIGKQEYLVSEIFLPVDKAAEERNIRQLAQKLVREVNSKKAAFSGVARQFSKAVGAAQGGTLGWVQKGQLPSELDEVLTTLGNGEVSNPIRTTSGFHILLLRESRMIEERIIPGRSALVNQIGMQRLDRLQRRTLQDLKAEAFIDRRV